MKNSQTTQKTYKKYYKMRQTRSQKKSHLENGQANNDSPVPGASQQKRSSNRKKSVDKSDVVAQAPALVTPVNPIRKSLRVSEGKQAMFQTALINCLPNELLRVRMRAQRAMMHSGVFLAPSASKNPASSSFISPLSLSIFYSYHTCPVFIPPLQVIGSHLSAEDCVAARLVSRNWSREITQGEEQALVPGCITAEQLVPRSCTG